MPATTSREQQALSGAPRGLSKRGSYWRGAVVRGRRGAAQSAASRRQYGRARWRWVWHRA